MVVNTVSNSTVSVLKVNFIDGLDEKLSFSHDHSANNDRMITKNRFNTFLNINKKIIFYFW